MPELPSFVRVAVERARHALSGRPREVPKNVQQLYAEWDRCCDDWDWVESPRGRWVDYQLTWFEKHRGVWQ